MPASSIIIILCY